MEKKLQDYIQYYLNCYFYLTVLDRKTRITNFWPQQDGEHCVGYGHDDHNGVCGIEEIKPILRKLDNMNDSDIKSFLNWDRLNELYVDVSYEKNEYAIVLHYSIQVDNEVIYPQSAIIQPKIQLRSDQFHHLIRHGFDVFGLIESGLAIDVATLPK